MADILFTYGTLRPGNTEPEKVPGKLYDLGWFPGIILSPADGKTNSFVLCERVEIEDIEAVDHYEGYNPNDPDGSLYIRRRYKDGWIYEFNGPVNPVKQIQSGDWLDYRQEERGVYGQRFTKQS